MRRRRHLNPSGRPDGRDPALSGVRLRAISYNVRSMRGGLDRVAGVMSDLDPDLALLQECGPRARLNRLAEALGMDAASSHRPFGKVRNAVLFRGYRPVWMEAPRFAREGRSSPRGFLAVHLRRPELSLTAVCTHLGLVPRERPGHVRALADFLAGIDGPVVVGADLNEDASGPAVRWVAQRMFDAWTVGGGGGGGETFPAVRPTARIDFLFVAGLRVDRAWVGTGASAESASDHLPVAANLEWDGRSG